MGPYCHRICAHLWYQIYTVDIQQQSSIYQIATTLTCHLNAQQSLLRLIRCCMIHRTVNKMQEHYCDCKCLFTLDLNIKRLWAINPIQGNSDSMPKSISQFNQTATKPWCYKTRVHLWWSNQTTSITYTVDDHTTTITIAILPFGNLKTHSHSNHQLNNTCCRKPTPTNASRTKHVVT